MSGSASILQIPALGKLGFSCVYVHGCICMHIYSLRVSQCSSLSHWCLNREIRFTCKVTDEGNRQSLARYTKVDKN